jgi:outer membrane protein assembly factor BamB
MTFDAHCVYASGNVPEKLLIAVRADGSGDVTESLVVWRTNQSNPYVPSSLIYDDMLFSILDSGIMVCRVAASGEEVWRKRLGQSFFASPIAAGGMIYALDHSGTAYVLRADRVYQLVAKNRLEETCFATPAISDDCIYIRTVDHLYCIGSAE